MLPFVRLAKGLLARRTDLTVHWIEITGLDLIGLLLPFVSHLDQNSIGLRVGGQPRKVAIVAGLSPQSDNGGVHAETTLRLGRSST